MYSKIMAVALVAVLAVGAFIVVNDDGTGRSKVAGETYTVTFDGNGGVPSVTSMTVTYGQPYGGLPSAYRDGDEFYEWNTAADGSGESISNDTIFDKKSDITLYARYVALYWITYELVAQGAQNDPDNRVRFTKFDSFDIYAPTAPPGSGLTFHGWWIDPDYSLMQVSHIHPGDFNGDIVLYAKWS